MSQQEKVRFVRINGRIVPIRPKRQAQVIPMKRPKVTSRDDMGIAVGSGAAAYGVKKIVAPAVYKRALQNMGEPMDIMTFRDKYAAFERASGRPLYSINMDMSGHASAMLTRARKRMKYKESMGLRPQNYKRPTIMAGMRTSEATLLHEMGHIRSSRRKFSFNRMSRKSVIELNRAHTHKGGVRPARMLKAAAKLFTTKAVRPFLSLADEAEATGEAIRAATKVGGWRHGLKIGKHLALPYGTYVAGASKHALIGYGAYRFGAGMLKMARGEE